MRRLLSATSALLLLLAGATSARAVVVTVSTSIANGTSNNAGRRLVKTTNGDLYSVRVGTDAITGNQHIYLSRSSDGGSSWVQVSTSPIVHDRDAQDQNAPSLAVDSADGLHLIWAGYCQGLTGCSDSGGPEAKLQYSSSPAGGTAWGQWKQIPGHSYEGFEGDPQLVIDGNDVLHVVWSGQNNGTDYEIRYASRPAQGAAFWSSYKTVMGPGTAPNNYLTPSLTIDSAGYLHVVAYGNLKQIHYSSKTLAAGAWSGNTQDISGYGSTYDQRTPVIAVDASNQLHVAWSGHDASNSNYQIKYAKRDTAGSWSGAADIQTISAANQTAPSIAVTGNGMVHVIWHGSDTVSGIPNIKYSTNAGGGWGGYSNLTLASSTQTFANFRWSPYRNNGGALDYVWTDNSVAPNYLVFSSNTAQAPPADLPSGCGAGVAVSKNSGGAYYASIAAGLAALPKSLTADTCVFIADTATYSEQVTVQGFVTNGHRLIIGSDTNLGSAPTIIPPVNSTAAFRIFNDSVTIQDIMIVATNTVTYGVLSSSAFARIDRVGVDSNNNIFVAGVSLSSFNAVANSSVTVQNAIGIAFSTGTIGSSISRSTAVNSASLRDAVYFYNATSNTVTGLTAGNANGPGVTFDGGSGANTITGSTLTSRSSGCDGGVNFRNAYLNTISTSDIEGSQSGAGSNAISFSSGAVGNTVSASYMSNNSAGCAMGGTLPGSASNTITASFLNGQNSQSFVLGGDHNAISFSTLTTNNGGGGGALVSTDTWNTVSDSFILNSGKAVSLNGSNNALLRSTATSTSAGQSALEFQTGAASATVSSCTVRNTSGVAVHFSPGSSLNTVSYSTVVANGGGVSGGLWVDSSSTNTITDSYIHNSAGHGALLGSGSKLNTISRSTVASGNSTFVGLYINTGSSSNTVSGSFIRNTDATAGGSALRIAANADFNTITQSTIVAASGASGIGFQVVNSSANALSFCYVSGSTAATVVGSTATSINMSQLVATAATGDALYYSNGVGLTIASSTLKASATGRGYNMDTGNSGALVMSTAIFTGSGVGIAIANQGAVTPTISSVTFRSMAGGSTGILFTANTPVTATFTLVNFEDATIAVNVNAASLAAGARVTMRSARGARRGTAFETDPGGYVDWDMPDWCADGGTVMQAGGGDFNSIQGAVNALPATWIGPTCIMIKDSATYFEQVTVRNFNTGGSTLTILADPNVFPRPVVSAPAGSTAAFQIANASVNIQGLDIFINNQVPYAVRASSGYVNISSVSISTGGLASVYTAGVSLSTWSTISYSSIVVGAALGVQFSDPIGRNTIAFSTVIATGGSVGAVAVDVVGSDSNTITGSYLQSLAGRGVYFHGGADYNTLAQSTITSAGLWQTVYIVAGASNTVSNSLVRAVFGTGLMMDTGSTYNKVAASSFSADDLGGYGIYINNSDSNTVTGSYILNNSGPALHVSGGSDWNTIAFSTIATGPSSSQAAMYLTAGDSNTISESYFQSSGYSALVIQSNSRFTTVSVSTIIGGGGAGVGALYITNSDGNRISSATIRSGSGQAVRLDSASDANSFSSSTFYSSGEAALYAAGSDSNTFTNVYMDNPNKNVVQFQAGADSNTISMSTVTSSNATGFPALQILNSSRNIVTYSFVTAPSAPAVVVPGGNLNEISFSTVIAGGGSNRAVDINAGDSNTVTNSYLQSGANDALFLQNGSDGNSVSFSTMIALNTAMDALYIGSSASNTVTSSVMQAPAGKGVLITGYSHHNTIVSSSMTSAGAATEAALYIINSSYNVVSKSWMYNSGSHAAYMQSAAFNTISLSTMTTGVVSGRGLYLSLSDGNAIDRSLVQNPFADAAELNSSHKNTISASSITATSGGGGAALFINGSDSNTITASYIENFANGRAVFANATSEGAMIAYSTIVTNAASFAALQLTGSALNTVSNSLVRNASGGSIFMQSGANYNAIEYTSVITAGVSGSPAILMQSSSSNTVTGSFVQSSTSAISIAGAAGSRLNSNRLVGTAVESNGVVISGSTNLWMSSNTVSAGTLAAGLYINPGNAGNIDISSNTFLPGSRYGVFAGNPTGASSLWITSNTILPLQSSLRDTYGIYLNGLTAGATVQNNGIYWRVPASASGFTSYGIYVDAALGQLIDHNRISNPGMVTAGSFVGVQFVSGGNSSQFKFNDVHSTGTALTSGTLLRVFTTSGLRHSNNVYSSSMAVSGSSATISLDAGSVGAGFVSNNNDFFSYNYFNTANYGGIPCQLNAGWIGAGCPSYDANSIAADPLWFNPGAGKEDFHPRSSVGRYVTGIGGFVTTDPDVSPTIDRGDPFEPVGAEPSPNGATANQGSYGQTPEASKTLDPCPVVKNVKQSGGGDSTTIQGAVNSLGSSLSDYTCVIIRDTATYNEQVTVQNIAPMGSSLTIMGAQATRPIVSPNSGGQTAAFWIMNSSVNLRNLVVTPRAFGIPYGILSSSDSVSVSSVNVNDAEGRVFTAALSIATQTAVSYTSVTWAGGTGNGLNITGSGNLVSFSTFGVFGGSPHAVVIAGASSNTITDVFMQSSSGNSLFITSGSNGNSVIRSTMTRQAGASGNMGLRILNSSSNTVTQSYVFNDNDHSVRVESAGSIYNQISLSTMVSLAASRAALSLYASSWTAVADSMMLNQAGGVGGYGMWLEAGPKYNTILRSTITASGTGNYSLMLDPGTSSNTITQAYVYSALSEAAYFNGAEFNTVSQSTFATGGTGAGAVAWHLSGASTNTFTRGVLSAGGGLAAYFNGLSSSNTISFSSASNNTGGQPAIYLFSASSNTITNSFIYNMTGTSLLLGSTASSNTVTQSTITSSGGGGIGLHFSGAKGNRVSRSYIENTGSDAVRFSALATFNVLTQSTVTTYAAGGNYAMSVVASGSNTISQSNITNGNGIAMYLSASNDNVFNGNRVASPVSNGVQFDLSSYNSFSQSFVSGAAAMVLMNGSAHNTVSFSTITDGGGTYALTLNRASSNTISSCYLEDVRAVQLSGSTGTVIADSVLNGTVDYALLMLNGNANTTLTRSTFMAAGAAPTIRIDQGSTGFVDISSNFIRGDLHAVRILATPAGTSVRIASNTITVNTSALNGTYGLYLFSLASGATIQYNNIVYRTKGSMGAFTSTAVYIANTPGVVFDHNRVSNPGMITAGSFYGLAMLTSSLNALIKFNDFHSTGTNLTSAYLVSITGGSSGFQLKNNIFSASMTVTGAGSSSATIATDGTSSVNAASDYNDFFSSNAFNSGDTGTASLQFLTAWQSATTQDMHSIVAHPRWADPGAGIENFHPRSQEGRYTSSGFVLDAETSRTIDGADPNEPFSAEASLNGGLANLGSYGNTPEASKTYTVPITIAGPADGAYVSVSTPSLGWSGTVPPHFRVIMAANAGLTLPFIDTSTSNPYHVSTNALSNTQYWWQVSNVGGAGISPIVSFTVDTASPALTAPAVSTALVGPFVSTSTFLASNSVTARITVQDLLAGMRVSTGAPSNMVGQWRLDESSGATAIDATTISGRGFLSGGVQWTQGVKGAAADFTTSMSSIQVAHNAALNSSDLTISLWVRPTMATLFPGGANPLYALVSKRTSNTTTPYVFGISTGGALALNWWGSSGGTPSPSSPQVVKLNQWQHVAVTRSGPAGAHLVTFFHNGVPVSSVVDTDPGSVRTDSTENLLIGLDNAFAGTTGAGNVSFTGGIDDVRIYSVARSSVEILSEYESDSLSAHNRGAAYSVLYSTTAGTVWNYVSTAAVTLTGGNGSTAAQTLTASSIPFTTNTSAVPSNNLVQFVAADMAGNAASATYEVFVDTTSAPPPGCTTIVNVRKSGVNAFTTIGAALGSLGTSLSAPTCVVIRDTMTYVESVTVEGIAASGNTLTIMADPALTTHPTVAPNTAGSSPSGAFVIKNASVSLVNVDVMTNVAIEYGVYASSPNVSITSVNVINPSGFVFSNAGIGLSGVQNGAVSYSSVTVFGAATAGLKVYGSTLTTVSASTFMALGTGPAVDLKSGSSNTFTVMLASAAGGSGMMVQDLTRFNTISMSTIANTSAGQAALYVGNGSSTNTLSRLWVYNPSGTGAFFTGNSNMNSVSQSTFTSAAAYSLQLNTSSNTLSGCLFQPRSANAVGIFTGASSNTITFSTMITNAPGTLPLFIQSSASNTISFSYLQNLSGASALLDVGANYNTIAQSTLNSSGGSGNYPALDVNGGDGNVVTGSLLQNASGHALLMRNAADFNTITLSTLASVTTNLNRYAAYILSAASNTIASSYIQGSTAVVIAGSSGTVITGSVIVSTGNDGSGVTVMDGSNGALLTLNTISAGRLAQGVNIDLNNSGSLIVSSNTLLAGMQNGIYVSSQTPGATSVWISSNTVLPVVSASLAATRGIWIDGLTSGATIQYNSIYYRSAGTTGVGFAFAVNLQRSSLIVIEHNRINQPGVVTGGNYGAVIANNTSNVIMKYNDINDVGSMNQTRLLSIDTDSNYWSVRNNVFASSVTAAVAVGSNTIDVDATSSVGFASDYNAFYSSNGPVGMRLAAVYVSSLAAWQAGANDANSISAHPLWASTTPGAEDFHPLSQAGRYPGFAGDATTSPTIDGADPADGNGAETAPHGGLPNLGSYGLTAEASRSPAVPAAPLITAVYASSVTVSFTGVGADSYIVQAAVSPAFTGVMFSSASAPGATSPLSPQGLALNTTYYVRAGAVWGALTKYAATTPASTATLSATPVLGVPPVTGVSTGALTLNWTVATNPAGTLYEARVSTSPNFTGTVNTSSLTYNVFLTTTGLAPNTTYFLSVAAVNFNGQRSAPNVISTVTLPAAPASVGAGSITSVNARSITLNWSSGTAVSGVNPYGTTYKAYASSDGFTTTVVSPSTTGLAFQFTGLVPNTTYQVSVEAISHNNQHSSFLPAVTTNTIAARPSMILFELGPADKDTSYGGFTDTGGLPDDPSLKYGGFGEDHHAYLEFNLAGAPAAAQATGADLKLYRTAATATDPALELHRVTGAWTEAGITSASQPSEDPTPVPAIPVVLSGLNTVNVLGLYRDWLTFGNNGVKIHSTVNSPDSSGAFASSDHPDATLRPRLEVTYSSGNVAFVTNTSIIVQWSSGSVSAGYNPAPTGYEIQASTDNFASVSGTAGTYSLSNTFAGLTPNTTYTMRVRAFSGQGQPTDYSTLGSTATLASAPGGLLSSTYTAVQSSSMTVSWSRLNNPLFVTTYTIVFSTDPFPNSNPGNLTYSTAPAGAAISSPTYTANGLSAFTTYYVEVAAVNHNGVTTSFTVLSPTQTLAINFAPPTTAGFAGVFNTSATVSWALVSGATGYTVLASTESFNPPAAVWASTTIVGGASTSGTPDSAALAPNTTYFFFVRANGAQNSSAYAAYAATSTLASPPAMFNFPSLAAGTIVSSWTPGLPVNPNGTLYELQTSTSPAFAGTVTSSATYNVFATTAGLNANTTYYFQVRAINNNGVATAFSGTLSTASYAALPATAVTTFPVIGQTSMTVTWLSGGNPLNVTTYTVVLSTDSFYPNSDTGNQMIASTMPAGSPLTATFASGALNPDTTYYLFVSALNYNNIPSGFAALGSTKTLFSVLFPAVIDNQGGDAAWRSSNNGVYNVDFADSSGLHLDKFQVKVSTIQNGAGPDLVAYTDVITSLSPSDSYTTDWSLPPAVFTAMLEGVTNYVTVKAFNGLTNSTTIQDAFYVLKDTTAPTILVTQTGDTNVRSAAGTLYDVDAFDTGSGVKKFQYSVSLTKLSGDQSLVPWTDIVAIPGSSATITADWAVNFALLASGPTNYISVRAIDQAFTTTTIVDAFFILKDTVGPTVAISAPSGAYASGPLGTISGTAGGFYPLKGTEVSFQQAPPGGPYWNGAAFASGAPVYFNATGQASWTINPGITWVNGTAYQIVARSSNTANLYSATYATAAFTFDSSTPTVAVVLPVPSSTISSLPTISGTAADPAFNSGLSSIEVRLRRNADGLWWNWFTETWSGVAISTVVGSVSPWSLTPSSTLQANLDDGASYFIAVRASDNATPPNAGDFLLQGATFTFADTTPPAGSTVTAVAGATAGSIDLSWNATGDDGNTGTILLGNYRIWYSTNQADAFSTTTAQIAFSTAMVKPGDPQAYTMSSLTPGVTYYVRVFLEDGDGNWSTFSNEASTVSKPSPSTSIIGHVVNTSTVGITAVQIDCWDTSGVLRSTVFTVADGSGTYTINGLTPGTYKIQASWTANGVTSSVWQDNIAMGSYGVDFVLEINYALATLTGTLGTMGTASLGPAGYGAASANTLGSNYFTASHIELFQNNHQVGQVGVSENGRWTISGLLPGSYQVRAYTNGGYTEFITVELAEGEIRVVGFVFDPLPEVAVFAFPNPARSATTIRFESSLFPLESQVSIFDLAGNLVKEIPGSQITSPVAGRYHAAWDLRNSRGEDVASGVYLFMVKVRGGSDNQKAKVIKKLAVVR